MRHLLVTVLMLLTLGVHSQAELRSWPMQLNHALWPEHTPKLIVAGTIESIDPGFDIRRSMVPHEVTFTFRVRDVVLGDQQYRGQLFSYHAAAIEWPDILVPYEVGKRCILVLETRWGDPRSGSYIYTVVPVSGKRPPTAHDTLEAQRILEGQILTVLRSEKQPERQAELLMQVAPILPKEHAGAIGSILRSDSVWIRRAALSALVYATEDPTYIRRMAGDVQAWLSTREPTDQHIAGHPFGVFYAYYFFLEKRTWTLGSEWNDAEAAKHLRILNAMFSTGLITDDVKKKLNPDPKDAPARPQPH